MSDTPRTDLVVRRWHSLDLPHDALENHARELERELAQFQATNGYTRLLELRRENAALRAKCDALHAELELAQKFHRVAVTERDALLAALGGRICVSGQVLTGQAAVQFLENMDPSDRASLAEDLKHLGALKGK